VVLDDNPNFLLVTRQMPRIAESLRSFWGCAEFDEFIRSLLTDSQDGKRRGFPPAIAQALFRLAEDHEAEFPQFSRGKVRMSEIIPNYIRDVYHKRRVR
jgi:hypothetical protein